MITLIQIHQLTVQARNMETQPIRIVNPPLADFLDWYALTRPPRKQLQAVSSLTQISISRTKVIQMHNANIDSIVLLVLKTL